MKIFLLLFVFTAMFFAVGQIKSSNKLDNAISQNPGKKYLSEKYGYEVLVPRGFAVNDLIPELVTIENSSSRLRINAGCYESGTEYLRVLADPLNLNGTPALKEEFYNSDGLKLKRVTLSNEKGRCFSLEEMAQTEIGWRELLNIRKTFQFVN